MRNNYAIISYINAERGNKVCDGMKLLRRKLQSAERETN